MKIAKAVALSSVLAASTVASSVVWAGGAALVGNVSVTNNYIFRGKTQTNDQAAVQGGLDYDIGSGFAVGTWVSNVDFGTDTANDPGTELDLYGSWVHDFGPIGFEAGVIKYTYPSQNGIDLTEVYAGAGYSPTDTINLGAQLYLTVDKDVAGPGDDTYLTVTADFSLGKDMVLGLVYGDYNYDDPTAEDYSHFQVSLNKGDFSFMIDKNDSKATDGNSNADDPRFTVMWTQVFDLM